MKLYTYLCVQVHVCVYKAEIKLYITESKLC